MTTTSEQVWNKTLLDYGLALLRKDELENQMQAAATVDEEQKFYRLWETQCEVILTIRGKLALMVKQLALQQARMVLETENSV